MSTNIEALISSYKEKVELYKQRKAKIQAQIDLQTSNLNDLKTKVFNLGFNSIEEAEEYVKDAQSLLEAKNKELETLFYRLDNEIYEEDSLNLTDLTVKETEEVDQKLQASTNMFDDLFS